LLNVIGPQVIEGPSKPLGLYVPVTVVNVRGAAGAQLTGAALTELARTNTTASMQHQNFDIVGSSVGKLLSAIHGIHVYYLPVNICIQRRLVLEQAEMYQYAIPSHWRLGSNLYYWYRPRFVLLSIDSHLATNERKRLGVLRVQAAL
jgi:hypothetical protein